MANKFILFNDNKTEQKPDKASNITETKNNELSFLCIYISN